MQPLVAPKPVAGADPANYFGAMRSRRQQFGVCWLHMPVSPEPEDEGAPDTRLLREELIRLRSSIPMFASWRTAELEHADAAYLLLLRRIAAIDAFGESCALLLDTHPAILEHIRLAVETGHWTHFNRAAIALDWDIESLLQILGRT